MKLGYFYILTFLFIAVVTHAKEVQVIDIHEVGHTMQSFYLRFGHEPVIVRGAYSGNQFIESLTPQEVEKVFIKAPVLGYEVINDNKGKIRKSIDGPEFFKDFNHGAKKYRVIDHTVVDGPFATEIKPPFFLQDNWLDELKAGWELNYTLSGAGSFTPFHEDGDGEQAWMYLVYGKKLWTFYPPAARGYAFNPKTTFFYNSAKDSPDLFPWLFKAEEMKYTATAVGGDLIWFPPGWIHQVITEEVSFGFGGNIVNEFLLDESVRTALIERETGCEKEFELETIVRELGERRTQTDYGKSQLSKALNRFGS